MRNAIISILKSCCFLFFLGSFSLNFAQTSYDNIYIPPSPNAASLVRFASIDVSHYTGVPNISVPLVDLPTREMPIPINLQYHSSGIKVQDVAPSVGLGWNLNAGGAITRIIRGAPDDIYPCGGATDAGSLALIASSIVNGLCDSEHDLYYFSFLGRSGKMVWNSIDNKAYSLPYQDILISANSTLIPGTTGSPTSYWKLNSWSIKDENGYEYVFGDAATNKESTTFFSGNSSTPSSYVQKFTFVSTWYLSKVISPRGFDVATFTYLAGGDISYELYSEKQTVDLNSAPTILSNRIDTKILITAPKYIQTISSVLGAANFNYGNRSDLIGGYYLSGINVLDNSSTIMNSYTFEYDYFNDYIPYGDPLPSLISRNGYNDCSRLKLIRIRENSNIRPYREFDYYSTYKMPPRWSTSVDHWGYYNGGSYLGNLPNKYISTKLPIMTNTTPVLKGMPKEHFESAMANILNRVTYPTGGYTFFEYQLNDVGGGCRIYKITDYDGTTVTKQSTFTYSGGLAVATPVYYFFMPGSTQFLTRYSDSQHSLYDMNGTSVGYYSVTETMLDGSKVVRKFSTFTDYPDIPPNINCYSGPFYNSLTACSTTPNPNGPPFSPPSSRAFSRGILKQVDYFNNVNLTQPIKTEVYNYSSGTSVADIQSRVISNVYFNGNNNIFFSWYSDSSYPITLANTTTTLYDQADLTKAFSSYTIFDYHPVHKTFPTYSLKSIATNRTLKTTFRYPVDITSTLSPTFPDLRADGYYLLRDNHIIKAVEVVTYLDNLAIDAQLTTFRRLPIFNRPILYEKYSMQMQTPLASFTPAALTPPSNFGPNPSYRLLSTYTFDNSTADMVSMESSSGIKHSMNWSNGLITKTSINEGPFVNSGKFYTTYNYNTIRGLLSVIDPNNQTASYVYDNLGRLKLVKDTDGNIISRYRYNFADANELQVDFSITGNSTVNQTNYFNSLLDSESNGNNSYVWDFGDGQVVQNSTKSVTHSYTTPGTFTVKLSKSNPEYGSLIATKQLTIYSAASVFISANSITIDLCSTNNTATVTANVSSGCAGITYSWYTKPSTSSVWSQAGGNSSSLNFQGAQGTTDVKCVIGNSCGQTAESNIVSITFTRSAPGCSIP